MERWRRRIIGWRILNAVDGRLSYRWKAMVLKIDKALTIALGRAEGGEK